jgi:uracil-DNA glycosylase
MFTELGFLARQLRFQGELDLSLGLKSSGVPRLKPLSFGKVRQGRDSASSSRSASSRSASSRSAARASSTTSGTSHIESKDGVRGSALGTGFSPGSEPSQASAAELGKELIGAPVDESGEQLAARRLQGERALGLLFSKLAACVRCPLHEGRSRLVFGQGDAAAEIVFVGEAPGYQEDKQGVPFCGPSGELLTKMIKAMGLDRRDVFIANIVKCRPPDNRNPQPDEIATCLPFLEQQLRIVRPRCIVALGKTAGVGLGLLRCDEALGRSRGFRHRWRGIRVMLTYHPAYLLRNPSAKRMAWHDLKQVLPYLRRRQGGDGS